MKTLHLAIIAALLITFIMNTGISASGYANPGPPPDPLFLTDNKGKIDGFLTNHQILIRADVWPRYDAKAIDIGINMTSDTGFAFYATKHLIFDPNTNNMQQVIWQFIPTKAGNYTVEKFSNGVHTSSTFFTVSDSKSGSNSPVLVSPLRQFKWGILKENIQCQSDSVVVFKTKDGSPACVKPDTAQKLVERKWRWVMQPIDSIKPLPSRISGFENDVGMVSLKNQTYYFDTPNYTKTSYIHPVQITFHDVNFTLFPPGFRGGLPIGGCPGQYYWVDVKFADGTAELLHIYAGSQSCADSVPIMLSNHILPQAGLAFSDGKMMLLVRDENQAGKDIVLQKPSSMVKPFPQCNPSPAKEKLIREKQQILTDALLSEEKKHGGFENRTQNLPWSFIGYDCVDNALEVGIPPQYFNSDSLPKYFEKIRSIVGNTIDVVLSPQDYALPL